MARGLSSTEMREPDTLVIRRRAATPSRSSLPPPFWMIHPNTPWLTGGAASRRAGAMEHLFLRRPADCVFVQRDTAV
jgi:hypothetical protein